jgi:hypothetical protein
MQYLKKQKSKLFFCGVVFLFCVTSLFVFFLWEKREDKTLEEKHYHFSSLRCGLDSLYLGLRFLTENSGRDFYLELAKNFPLIEREGTTVSAIRTYLQEHGFACSRKKPATADFINMNSNCVVFLLEENNPLSHIVLLWKNNLKELKLIDNTRGVRAVTPEEAANVGTLVLFVAKDATDLPSRENRIFKYSMVLFLFIASLALYIFARGIKIKREREEKIKTKILIKQGE